MYIKTSDQPEIDLGFRGYVCNWGLHLCGLYETAEERDEILFSFLHRGDLNGDRMYYVPVERSPDDFHQEYNRRYPDCAGHTHNPACFGVVSPSDLYYPSGVFSPWDMEDRLGRLFADSQSNGPRNMRSIAEMAWALQHIPGVNHLMAYESRLNYLLPGKPWATICLYNTRLFSGATVMGVLQTHPFVINGGVLTANPYYRDPDDYLRANAPEFLTENKPSSL